MRTKALLLGALPSPIEGEWIPIHDGDGWTARIQGPPIAVFIEVRTARLEVVRVLAGTPFCGLHARVVLEDSIASKETISVFLDECK